jgi:hypothetical protein
VSKVVYLGIDCILILVEDGLPWQYQHLRPIPPIECILVTLVQVLFLQDHQSVEKTNPWPSRPLARFRPSATKKTPNAIHPTRTSKTERKTPSRHVCILPAHHVDAVSTVSSLHVCIPFVTPCPPRYAAIAKALHCPVAEACVEEKKYCTRRKNSSQRHRTNPRPSVSLISQRPKRSIERVAQEVQCSATHVVDGRLISPMEPP